MKEGKEKHSSEREMEKRTEIPRRTMGFTGRAHEEKRERTKERRREGEEW